MKKAATINVTLDDVITVSQSPPVLEAASTDQALSATPSYFSGTGCNVFAAASPISGYIAHAQMWIGGILVAEYDDTGTTPFSTDPTLVHTYGSNQPRTNLNVLFDSTHFADTTALPIKLQVWDSTGQNGYVTIIAPVYNKAYVLGNHNTKGGTFAADYMSVRSTEMNLSANKAYSDSKSTILTNIPAFTAFYIYTHGTDIEYPAGSVPPSDGAMGTATQLQPPRNPIQDLTIIFLQITISQAQIQ